jgi:hypothetical protein
VLMLSSEQRHSISAQQRLQDRCIGSIRWLCSLAGPDAVQAATATAVPGVPAAVADVLLDAGVRISYQQLLSAAQKQLWQMHVWLKSGLTALPAWVEQIVCS